MPRIQAGGWSPRFTLVEPLVTTAILATLFARGRGIMLLIVLALLSMFLMPGTLLIANRSRSRLTAWVNSPDVPIDKGYGPADIDASTLFVEPLLS